VFVLITGSCLTCMDLGECRSVAAADLVCLAVSVLLCLSVCLPMSLFCPVHVAVRNKSVSSCFWF